MKHHAVSVQNSYRLSVCHFLGAHEQLLHRVRRVTCLQHGTENVIRVAPGTGLTQSTFVIHPGVNDDFLLAGEAIEEPVSLMELGPEPVPIVRAQRISLAKRSRAGISGNDLPDVTIDCGQQLRARVLFIACRILRRESVHLRH